MTLTATRDYGYAGAVLTELAVSAPTFPGWSEQQTLLPDPPSREFDVKLRKRTMTIRLIGEAPAWLKPTIQTMQQIAQLPANWSSYGSSPIEDVAIIRAAELLAELLESDGPAPTVIPTLRGGVQLEWHRNGSDVEIELSPEGVVSDVYVCDRQTDRTWEPERVAPEVLQRLKTTIKLLGRR